MTAGGEIQGKVLVPFSTPIFRVKLSGVEDINKEMTGVILHRRKTQPGKNRSNQGGWQSAHDLHLWPEKPAQLLCSRFLDVATQALSNYYPTATPITVGFQQVWANVNPSGSWNLPHSHGTAWVGSYYIRTRAEGKHQGAISFINPLSNPHMFWQKPEISMEPEAGELIIFPGCMLHYVEPNPTNAERIGIAMNFGIKTEKSPWSFFGKD